MSTDAGQPHTALLLYVQGGQVAVQPKLSSQAAQLETLSIDLRSGSVQVLTSSPQPGTPKEVLGLLGLCKLRTGTALIAITEARHAATLDGAGIFEVVKTEIITAQDARANKENAGLLSLLEEAVDPGRAGRGLHFSYFYDLTHTAQRITELKEQTDVYNAQVPAQRADQRFFWNRAVARPLIAADAHRFVLPCILGFVEQLHGLEFKEVGSGHKVNATLTLIARRDAARSGTRQWRRGADPDGNVANFVETEQLLVVDGPPSVQSLGASTSYVVTRGSIPLLWTQLPNIKYKPTTVIGPADVSGPAHDKHLSHMVDKYKHVVAINLVNQHGTEGKLEAAFRSEAQRATAAPGTPLSNSYRYVAFDFHKECGKGRYHRLTYLWDQVKQDFEVQGFFHSDAGRKVARTQAGVIRVNCIDCLDRTNVVQGILARKALESVLGKLNLLPTKADGSYFTLPEAYPEVEAKFKWLWADHGDAVSQQYAGTGAMKSGFTRTGKRTFMGVLDDGYKAVARYYLNNYQDGRKQDAIDLLTGAFMLDTNRPLPLHRQPSALIPILLAFLAVAIGAHNLGAVVRLGPAAASTAARATGRGLLSSVLLTGTNTGAPAAAAAAGSITMNLTAASVVETAAPAVVGVLLRHVALPLFVGLGLLALVVQNGKHLVNKPLLCPQLAITVKKQPKKAA